MKKTLITILVVIALVLALLVAGALGFLWYRDNHVFVEGNAYPIDAQGLDLREEDISFDHYRTLQAALPECEILWNVPFQDGKQSSDSTEIVVKSLAEEDIEILMHYFPKLKKVDCLDCEDYAAIELLKAQLPEAEVLYEIKLGNRTVLPDSTELVLEVGDYDYDTLRENLLYLPHVKSIQLKTPEITLEQVNALRETYPEIAITCTVNILGVEYDSETTELDLSLMTPEDAVAVVEQLAMLPNLTYVNLTPPNGIGALSKEDVKNLMEAVPEVVFDFTFDFYGEMLSTATEEVHIKNTKGKRRSVLRWI